MGIEDIRDSDIVEGLSVRYLKVLGLWGAINTYRISGRRNLAIKLVVGTTILLNMPYVLCQFLVYFFVDLDLHKAAVFGAHAFGCLQLCARCSIFWRRLGSQCRIYELVRNDFLSVVKREEATAKEIYRKVSSTTNLVCLASFIVNLSIIVACIWSPSFLVEYIEGSAPSLSSNPGGRKKVLGGWYPGQISKSPYYEVVFYYEVALIAWDAINLTVFVSMFYQPLMCLYAHFLVLGHHITTLKVTDVAQSDKRNQNRDSAIYKQLYSVLKDHQKLISLSNEVRDVYNPLVTMILAMGIMILVNFMFQFLFEEEVDPIMFTKFIQFLFYQGIEVAMFCLGSAYVQQASSDLTMSMYSSEWYKADLKYRKSAQMVMVRAGKGVLLTAVRMYPVNAQTMMSIFQFTYSASTLLSRMVDSSQNSL